MKITKQTTYSLPALTVDDLAAGVSMLQETSGGCEIIRVESEYSWDENHWSGERKNTQGAVFVTVQENA